MIRDDSEYQEALRRRREVHARLPQHRERLEALKLSAEEVERALDAIRSFHAHLEEEIEQYERLKRGEPGRP